MNSDETVFAEARALPANEREAFLVRACADDPALRVRVEELLAGYAEAERALPTAFVARQIASREEKPSDMIGRYKLLQKLGEGGFGVVWMAEQEEPVRRRVALKVIKPGMDTKEVIARFEAERQALALMDHPNIARVFDGGATSAGRPYFVMELVRGARITSYCDESRASAEARLRLFIAVCQAVQHAHQKGVIHRDLKPSNVLVTLHDGVPVPKIIDFGIAKATGARLTDKTLFTQLHAFMGTPAYTSPEQMEMSGLDVDTRSDIYSLGVLLYELLMGRPPFDGDALMKSGLDAMRRTIREVDPPRPSERLGTLSEADRSSVAQQRNTDPVKLSLLLRGDLDWIVMRCLEKDRSRRYETATGLANDVERHLRNELVLARPPSRVYRAQKFIRRHKFAATATAAVAASLIAGLVVASVLLIRERTARRRATFAERNESELRRQAEVVGASEVKRAARTALDLANRNLADGRVADGLAYLVYASRKDPKNTTLGPRLASALATHNFLLPDGPAFECDSRVLAVRFTKDGRSIYVGTEDGTFRVLDAASGRLQNEFRLGRPAMLGGWEFPRDNDTVFAVRFADNALGVFEVASGRARWTPRALDATVWKHSEPAGLGHGAGISPDGRWVYALAFYRFWIWDAATGNILLQPQFDQSQMITSCDFTRDGAQLAVTVGDSVKRWTLPDASLVATPIPLGRKPPASSAWIVRFTPDGHRIAVVAFTGPAAVRLFDFTTCELLRSLPSPGDYLNSPSVEFTSDTRVFGAGSRASGSWDLTSGEFKPLPIGLGADVISTSFDSAGRRLLAISADGFARLCDLESGELVAEPGWRQRRVFCAALAPDGAHVVIGNATGTVLRLRVGRGSARPLVLPRAISLPLPAPFLPETTTRLLWMKRDRARVLDLASGREVAGSFKYPEPVLRMSWLTRVSPVRSDLKFMVARIGPGWQAWELGATGVKHVAILEGSPEGGPMTFSPRGDLVLISFPNTPGETGKVGIWNLRTGTRVGPFLTFPSDLVATTPNFSPDGKRVALGTTDGTCMIVDLATARPVVTFATRPLVPNVAVWFSPDGTRVATFNHRNEARVWNATTGEPISAMLDAEYVWGSAQYSPDGRWFATWGVHTTSLWDGRTGAAVGETIPAGGRMVRFSQDSRSLGTADDGGIARVWEIPSGQPFTEPMRHDPAGLGRLESPESSPDGRFLRTEKPQEFIVWSVPPRLPESTPVPEWLLQLATVLATKTVNDAGQLVDVPDAMTQFANLCRQIAALPADAPLAEWGRWIIDDRTNRSIAPGFTITPEEAANLAAAEVAELAAKP